MPEYRSTVRRPRAALPVSVAPTPGPGAPVARRERWTSHADAESGPLARSLETRATLPSSSPVHRQGQQKQLGERELEYHLDVMQAVHAYASFAYALL